MLKKKEKNKINRPCDYPGCPECGEYKAPKDRSLRDYYWFCLKHVQEYNKNWNFYAGLSFEEVEEHNRNDITWQRPTWKMGDKRTVSGHNFKDPLGLHEELGLGMNGKHNPPVPEKKYEKKFHEALTFLELELPVTVSELKKQYKKMAKKYHPDANKGSKNAEKLFQKLVSAYEYVLKRL